MGVHIDECRGGCFAGAVEHFRPFVIHDEAFVSHDEAFVILSGSEESGGPYSGYLPSGDHDVDLLPVECNISKE